MAVIRIRGARQHNLRGVDVDIPRDRLVVVCGVSGSGKSSLALDVLAAEGRRRLALLLSPWARRAEADGARPDVEQVDGLTPVVAVSGPPPAGRRSSAATLAGLSEPLRRLFAGAGTPHCPGCGVPVERWTAARIAAELSALPEGTRVVLLAPVARGRAGPLDALLAEVERAGFARVRLDGALVRIDEVAGVDPSVPHDLDVVVDRVRARPAARSRLYESAETALRAGRGAAFALVGDGEERRFSERLECPRCGRVLPEPTPALLDPGSPAGRCPECRGSGRAGGGDEDAPPCPACGGARLRPEGAAVRLRGLSLPELLALDAASARSRLAGWLDGAPPLPPDAAALAREALARLDALVDLGLDHLPLDRPADTLSTGEAGRARAAGALARGIQGITYVLDEPGAGLHPADRERLLGVLRRLRDEGNTVIVVDHDPVLVAAADHVVELGPGAGPKGGRVLHSGPPAALPPDTPTGRHLAGRAAPPTAPPEPPPERWIAVRGARARNLRGVDARFPVGRLSAVAGPSGAGKTSLLLRVLGPALRAVARGGPPARCAGLEGAAGLGPVVELGAAVPGGRSRRSTPATMTGLMDELRRAFAETREARVRGWGPERFAYTSERGGRCPACRGEGWRRAEGEVLGEPWVRCELCRGRRYDEATLEVRWRGLDIAEVLDLTVDEARPLLAARPRARRLLEAMARAGLGYLRLGQPADTLSAGEAQRLRLARLLAGPPRRGTVLLLDEPTTGLHPDDAARLVDVLVGIARGGATAVAAGNHPELLARAAWVVELGPGGGPRGGRVVREGPPGGPAPAAQGWR